MSENERAWFINFLGIGNGVVIVPLLRCFENTNPLVKYFHTENQILSDRWFLEMTGLKNLSGFSSDQWRRFEEKNWDEILRFIKINRIHTVVNLRNEGPRYDIGYYRFKEKFASTSNLAFWDLNFATIGARLKQENLTKDLLSLLSAHGIDISRYDPRWLFSAHSKNSGMNQIGFGLAASRKNKRWPMKKWIELGIKIEKSSSLNILLFPGLSDEEVRYAHEIRHALGESRCELGRRDSLQEVAIQIGKLNCFISNDTGLLHMSAAINIPSVGIYTSTNPDIWSPYVNDNFYSCRNSFMEKCPAPKIHCGNCFHYYDACPAVTKYGDDITPSKVYKLVRHLMD
jgi:ADP-heptose:LPS heptosyltransferase